MDTRPLSKILEVEHKKNHQVIPSKINIGYILFSFLTFGDTETVTSWNFEIKCELGFEGIHFKDLDLWILDGAFLLN